VKNLKKPFNIRRATFFLLVFISCIFAGAVLKLAASVILPFTIAILLSFIAYPLMKLLDKYKIPRFLSIFLIVILITIGLVAFGIVLFNSGWAILSMYPKYEERLTEIYIWIAQLFELPYDESISFWQNLWGQFGVRAWIFDFTRTSSNSVLSFTSSAFLVIFFIVFILLEASVFREKLETAFEGKSGQINKMGRDLMDQVTRYLVAKFFISLANGVIFAVAFHLVGLEFAIVWGVIQFIMNFIPNLGSIITGVGISLFALVQFWPSPGPIIAVVIIVLAVNMILGNIIDPKIIGEHVGISPLIVLVSLVIWGWIWGFAGMILSVPMTVIIKIVCENIPIMEPVSVFLGTRRSVLAKKNLSDHPENSDKQEKTNS
jgi:predicted PurR-regulated permease PerM